MIITWTKPSATWVKLNTDGSRNTVGQIEAGGICKDHLGNLIMAFQQHLGTGSSNLAEAKAVMVGLKWGKERNSIILHYHRM
ncbi:putative E3 ubiquitin-protein ligase RING1-like [Capsicum annuum]|nr:putative E3 ubiquitin-protein ligase RING1-like [Capsicum annuum]